MTYDEVKELLKSLRSKKSRLKALQTYIAEERVLMTGLSGVNYEKISVVTSPGNVAEERYAKHLDRICTLQGMFDDLFDEMCKEEEALSTAMKKLTQTEYEVVLNRYMRGISRKETADIMGYSDDGIKSASRRAIKKMSDS
jgi:DNA-directed RNA polymerase specialized sigma subunit